MGNTPRRMEPNLENADKKFETLCKAIVTDLEDIGNYSRAGDGDDDESIETYNTLFCHPIREVAAVYVQRLSDAHTVTVTACDDKKKDIAINSMDEWKNVRSRISGDGGLSFENAN
jgi:hypothetical protein